MRYGSLGQPVVRTDMDGLGYQIRIMPAWLGSQKSVTFLGALLASIS